jgi:hypothetical protein
LYDTIHKRVYKKRWWKPPKKKEHGGKKLREDQEGKPQPSAMVQINNMWLVKILSF